MTVWIVILQMIIYQPWEFKLSILLLRESNSEKDCSEIVVLYCQLEFTENSTTTNLRLQYFIYCHYFLKIQFVTTLVGN